MRHFAAVCCCRNADFIFIYRLCNSPSQSFIITIDFVEILLLFYRSAEKCDWRALDYRHFLVSGAFAVPQTEAIGINYLLFCKEGGRRCSSSNDCSTRGGLVSYVELPMPPSASSGITSTIAIRELKLLLCFTFLVQQITSSYCDSSQIVCSKGFLGYVHFQREESDGNSG